ncbi:hypothetical protein [Glycomyces tarimensis]
MLPQPNFGHSSGPEDDDKDEVEGPPRQIGRLRIAMWVQAVCAVLAGNFLIVTVFAYRAMSVEDLIDAAPDVDDAASLARDAHEYYQSTDFLAMYLTLAGVAILCAIVAALCALRLKTRMRAVRRTAIAVTIVLFLAGMLMTGIFSYLVAPWVFASVLALWWLFAGDVRHWMTEKSR